MYSNHVLFRLFTILAVTLFTAIPPCHGEFTADRILDRIFPRAHHLKARHHVRRSSLVERTCPAPVTVVNQASDDGNVRNNNPPSPSPFLTPSKRLLSQSIYSKYKQTSDVYRPGVYPHLTDSSGAWVWEAADWWTAGFYPGTLYLLHERSKLCPGSTNIDWLQRGRQWSDEMIPLTERNAQGHDVGFMAYPFFHELNENPNNQTARQGIDRFATTLAARYEESVGCTRSWDGSPPHFLVIMDNMMNLDLLFQAGSMFRRDNYAYIAQRHANTTAAHHLRPDASSYHVVDYNQYTGEVMRQYTAQGFADWSTWSRGQAWGTYGFTTMYLRTGDAHYLDTARAMGQKWLDRLAEDPSGVPKWDFDAPEPTSRDTSAAAIISTAFLHIAQAETSKGNSTGAIYWKNNAIRVISTTADQYLQESSSWEAILSDGTSNHPSNRYDTGIVYGDYYFVKAGNMMLEMGLIGCQ
ncbi:hypothetical protein FRC18_003524 [Serendipita sp. 400]|nr:hypothetical protein FRC18_003524 [Serendipita sp. 400]